MRAQIESGQLTCDDCALVQVIGRATAQSQCHGPLSGRRPPYGGRLAGGDGVRSVNLERILGRLSCDTSS